MMSIAAKLSWVRESRGSPPAEPSLEEPANAPFEFTQVFNSEGFAGGVPLNTETAAVNPRVGVD